MMQIRLRPLAIAFVFSATTASVVPVAEAHITRIVIDPARSESPAFEGRVFGPDGKVGPYEKLRGRAYGEVDPDDPRNAVMTDISRAPRNGRGKVEYSMDIFILKPIDLKRGNHKVFLDFNNRGEMRVAALNDTALSNNPTKAAHAGTGFIMNLGYSIVGNGWDFGATKDDDGMTISVPVARNPDGSSITGPSYEYINFDDAKSVRYELTYPAATLDQSLATLTVRARLDDQPTTIPASGWEYVDAKTIRLLPAGTPFRQSHVYELIYTAKDPVVAALGLAATRDLVSFLRHAAKDEAGSPNPLAGDVRYTFSFSISQPSRTLNDFQALGFNEDEQGRRVIDGMLKWTGGGSGDQINYRFAQTGRTERNRQNHLYPEGVFPFAYPMLTDHLSGRSGGRLARCTASDTCPKNVDANSSNEYWVKAGSLLHTDTRGNDLPDPATARFYLISGLSHGVGNVTSRGQCQQFLNPTSPFPALRALLMALDAWVVNGTEPPPSQVPRQADKTAVMAVPRPGHQTGVVPQDALGWPSIPGVIYTGVITSRYQLDFGPALDKGLISHYPPPLAGRHAYPHFVSRVDRDGNEMAGIRLPPVEAPIATTTGWALRRDEFGANDGCEASGQHVAFKTTRAERLAAGDPRLSLEERYTNHDGYVAAVRKAAEKLEKQRFLLPADVRQYIAQAQASNVLGQAPAAPARDAAVKAIPGIIAAGAKFTQVFQTVGNNVDGIVAASDGSLLASQEDNNAVLKIDKDDRVSVYLAGVAVGSLSFDRQGRLFAVRRIAQPNTPAITQPSAPKTSGISMLLPELKVWDTLADGTKMMARPSDLSADGTGGAYFTQQCCVYYATPSGTIVPVGESLRTNGIILSEDDTRLYVTNDTTIVVFDVQGPGRLTNQREFVKLQDGGNGDGLAVDTNGNLYVAAGPGVQIYNRQGKYVGLIPTPTSGRPTGQAFVGPDRKTMYVVVTATTDAHGHPLNGRTVYRIPTLAQGLRDRSK